MGAGDHLGRRCSCPLVGSWPRSGSSRSNVRRAPLREADHCVLFAHCPSVYTLGVLLVDIIRTYAVGVLMGGLAGRVPCGCPAKILFLWATCGGKAAARGPHKGISGAAGCPLGVAPAPPPR